MKLSSGLILLVLFGCGSDGGGETALTLRFDPRVGTEAFTCGQTYSGLGTAGADLTPTDFRFYVHDVRVVAEDGTEVPVALDDDGMWQNGEVALLDFEDNCGDMGNADLRSEVRGTVPEGTYTGVRFRVGVPEGLNGADFAMAGPPLNLTSMWWTWGAGYKFLRVEGSSSAFEGWRLHLGSTACSGDAPGEQRCASPNVIEVSLPGDPSEMAIVADLASLVAASSLDNAGEMAPGCMSGPMDSDCAPLFEGLGLPFGGAGAGEQRLFRAD